MSMRGTLVHYCTIKSKTISKQFLYLHICVRIRIALRRFIRLILIIVRLGNLISPLELQAAKVSSIRPLK